MFKLRTSSALCSDVAIQHTSIHIAYHFQLVDRLSLYDFLFGVIASNNKVYMYNSKNYNNYDDDFMLTEHC